MFSKKSEILQVSRGNKLKQLTSPFLQLCTDSNPMRQTTAIKLSLEYYPMSPGNTYIAEPNLEVLT